MNEKAKRAIVKIQNFIVGAQQPLLLLAGPCVIESRDHILRIAESLTTLIKDKDISFVFKASYDKANRTSIQSFRGPGLDEGLRILAEVKKTFAVPVVTDIHQASEAQAVGEVADIIQIPAFLCRQTDLLVAAAQTGRVINIKKGQFLSAQEMIHPVKKVEASGNTNILLTERGTTFGYNMLVSDFRSIELMKAHGYPVVFDATHSVQMPGGLGSASGGQREFVPLLARCAMAAGADGLFMEVHTDPDQALSDGPNMLSIDQLKDTLPILQDIYSLMAENVLI